MGRFAVLLATQLTQRRLSENLRRVERARTAVNSRDGKECPMKHERDRSMTMRYLLIILALVISVAIPPATAHADSPGQLLWQDRIAAANFVGPADVEVPGDESVGVGPICDAPVNTTLGSFP